MDDEQVAQFTGITAATESQAEQYLRLTEGNLEQAIQLFFEDPSLASAHSASGSAPSQPQPASSSRPKRKAYTEDEDGVVHVDSDDEEDFEMSDVPDVAGDLIPDTNADEEMARKLQEEMYSGSRADPESVRAPMARTTETLVGGPHGFDDADISRIVQQQMLGAQQRRTNTRGYPHTFRQHCR
jgi:UBX domain-containing protein 7